MANRGSFKDLWYFKLENASHVKSISGIVTGENYTQALASISNSTDIDSFSKISIRKLPENQVFFEIERARHND